MIEIVEGPEGTASGQGEIDRWLMAIVPTDAERSQLTVDYALPQEFVGHCLDADERPHAERTEDAYLLVLRIPCVEEPGGAAPYATVPLGLIVRGRTAAVVCGRETRIGTLVRADARSAGPWRRRRIVLHMFRLAAEMYLVDLKTINDGVDALEDRLRESLENREVLELLRHQKALVYLSTALESNLLLLGTLQHDAALPVGEGDPALLEDVIVEMRQALDVAKLSRDILSEMMDAFASIISNNLNNVMRFLAAITVVLTIPVLLASFWGMNVKLPLEETPYGFVVLLAVSLVSTAALVAAFRLRRWL